ncbi:hypothetical protein GCM10010431_54970 [Streptomyces kunmingensis]
MRSRAAAAPLAGCLLGALSSVRHGRPARTTGTARRARPDPQGRRSHNARLTPAGVTTAEAITTAATAALRGTLSVVPAATQLDTLEQLQSILGAVDNAPPAMPDTALDRLY